MTKSPPASLIFGLVSVSMIALAGVLFVSGDDALQRLALLFGVIGTSVTALVASLRASAAADALNSGLDDRMQSAVFRAQNVRRRQVEREKDDGL